MSYESYNFVIEKCKREETKELVISCLDEAYRKESKAQYFNEIFCFFMIVFFVFFIVRG